MESADWVKRLRETLRPVEGVDAGAAVALLLNQVGRDQQLLLVKRAINTSDPWSGDMALPGGRRHSQDGDLWETVVRETLEETGIDLRSCHLLGALDIAESHIAPRLGILPLVVLCNETPEISLKRGELSSYLWVEIERLRRSTGRVMVRDRDVPAYVVDGEVVWGLTHRIVESLLRLME